MQNTNCKLTASPQKTNIKAQSNIHICSEKQSYKHKQNNTDVDHRPLSLKTHIHTPCIPPKKEMTWLYRQKQQPCRITLTNFKKPHVQILITWTWAMIIFLPTKLIILYLTAFVQWPSFCKALFALKSPYIGHRWRCTHVTHSPLTPNKSSWFSWPNTSTQCVTNS